MFVWDACPLPSQVSITERTPILACIAREQMKRTEGRLVGHLSYYNIHHREGGYTGQHK